MSKQSECTNGCPPGKDVRTCNQFPNHCPLCVVHSGRKGGIEFKRRQQQLEIF